MTMKTPRRRSQPSRAIGSCRIDGRARPGLRRGRALLRRCCPSRTRLKILHAICNSERSVSAIVAATGATQTNVSRHLALMHQAGVVSRRRDGNAVYYRVDRPGVRRDLPQRLRADRRPHRGRRAAASSDLLDFAAQHDSARRRSDAGPIVRAGSSARRRLAARRGSCARAAALGGVAAARRARSRRRRLRADAAAERSANGAARSARRSSRRRTAFRRSSRRT